MRRIISNNWKDQHNKEIKNKFTYLKTSIKSNIAVIESNAETEDAESDDDFLENLFKHLFHSE